MIGNGRVVMPCAPRGLSNSLQGSRCIFPASARARIAAPELSPVPQGKLGRTCRLARLLRAIREQAATEAGGEGHYRGVVHRVPPLIIFHTED